MPKQKEDDENVVGLTSEEQKLAKKAQSESMGKRAQFAMAMCRHNLGMLQVVDSGIERERAWNRARGWFNSSLKASSQAHEAELAKLMEQMEALQAGEGSVESIQ